MYIPRTFFFLASLLKISWYFVVPIISLKSLLCKNRRRCYDKKIYVMLQKVELLPCRSVLHFISELHQFTNDFLGTFIPCTQIQSIGRGHGFFLHHPSHSFSPSFLCVNCLWKMTEECGESIDRRRWRKTWTSSKIQFSFSTFWIDFPYYVPQLL